MKWSSSAFMAVSIYDVAKKSGLSIATVSRVLNNTGNVRPQTAQKVELAIQELGYTSNQLARALAHQRSGLVGVLMNDIQFSRESFYIECLAGIGEALERQGYHVVLLYENSGGSEICKEYLQQHLIDGLLALDAYTASEMLEQLAQEPDCVVGYIGYPRNGYACNVYGGYHLYVPRIMQNLWDAGHQKVLAVTEETHNTRLAKEEIARQRRQGVTLPAGIRFLCHNDMPTENEWHSELQCALQETADYTAIYADDIKQATYILFECRNLGLTVPEKVSIVTVEHREEEAAYLNPALDTFCLPSRQMGKTLAEMLLRRMNGVIQEEQQTVEGHFCIRGSVRRPL